MAEETPPTYTQRFEKYGNRGKGVKQAAKDRKRLMEIRKATPKPTPPDTSGELAPGLLTETLPAMGQEARFDELRKQGKNPGYNLGLSENEIGFNKALRNTIQSNRKRVDQLREKLSDVTNARQRAMIQNKIGRQNYRTQNFKAQLFAPEGANAGMLPQYERMNLEPGGPIPRPAAPFRPRPVPPPARPGMNRPKKPKGGNTGGVTPR